jgi:hypothetical protein
MVDNKLATAAPTPMDVAPVDTEGWSGEAEAMALRQGRNSMQCYKYGGKGHVARECATPKRKGNAAGRGGGGGAWTRDGKKGDGKGMGPFIGALWSGGTAGRHAVECTVRRPRTMLRQSRSLRWWDEFGTRCSCQGETRGPWLRRRYHFQGGESVRGLRGESHRWRSFGGEIEGRMVVWLEVPMVYDIWLSHRFGAWAEAVDEDEGDEVTYSAALNETPSLGKH